jgi:hypothetical protein
MLREQAPLSRQDVVSAGVNIAACSIGGMFQTLQGKHEADEDVAGVERARGMAGIEDVVITATRTAHALLGFSVATALPVAPVR